jgi:4-amino-4-deoxychorismate lyase
VESAVCPGLPPDLKLIETIAWRRNPGFINLPEHLARLERTARVFRIPFDRDAIDRALAGARGDLPLRVRLTLGLDGAAEVTLSAFGYGPEVWNLRIAPDRLDPADPWLRVKTSMRTRYDAARAALPRDIHELLYLNTRGEVCEGTIFNVFLKIDGSYLTPRLACGLLPGVLRQIMLRDGRAREAVLRVEDLRRGQLFLGNSLRGLCVARLV